MANNRSLDSSLEESQSGAGRGAGGRAGEATAMTSLGNVFRHEASGGKVTELPDELVMTREALFFKEGR